MGSRRLCAIGHDLCSSRQDHLQRLLASWFTLKTIWHLGVIALLWFYLGSFFAVDGHVIHLFPSFLHSLVLLGYREQLDYSLLIILRSMY